ncbi:lysM domain-containing protein [Pochonia chlamydosporia 170]|uniref:LysM domain-containing protein n=1 Tax=Pochonia chlamydosporia 170 TaxID=1380566 RepID=A0A179FXR9_METCM|nr:lysM domain-containing protein [Pochonia chlamydosporia 170]OAQ69980.1 lysM domain-containing protein [Pochonia chlamydosporia 170]
MVDNCNKFYFVRPSDSCAGVAVANEISLTRLVTWNPKAGQDGIGLWTNTYACVSVIAVNPTPAVPGNGIATPTPTQPGMIRDCNKFYKIIKGDTWDSITSKTGIPLDDFARLNTEIGGRACICVSTIGYKPQPPTLPPGSFN